MTSLLTTSQQSCQKAKVKPFGPGALSPHKLDKIEKTSHLEKGSSKSTATASDKELDTSPSILGHHSPV